MGKELKYKISMSADTSGALESAAALGRLRTQTEDVMNSMASRAGAAQMGFMGIERAAKGDTAAMFGLARAVKALWEVFANGSPAVRIITMLVMAIGLISAAYQKFKTHQEASTKAMEEASDATKKFQAALKALNDARNALNMNPQIKSLDQLTKAFERASKAMENMHNAEDKLRGERNKIELAGVDDREATATRLAGGDKSEENRIKFNANRERLGVKSSQDYAGIAAQEKQIQERANFLRDKSNNLNSQRSREDVFGKAGLPGPLAASEDKVAGLKKELDKIGVTEGGKTIPAQGVTQEAYLAKAQEHDAALKENKALRDIDEKRNAQIEEGIAATQEELTVLEKQQNVLEEQKKTLYAETAAADAKISAEQQSAQIALDEEAAQKRLLALKQQEKDVRDGILRAAQETAAVAEEESGETVADLKDNTDYLQKKYAHQYKRATDPAYRQATVGPDDPTTKDEAREQKRWKQQVKRAYDQRKRGARSKLNDETIRAAETGKGARQAEKDLQEAQRNMAMNIQKSKEYLFDIREKINPNLS